MQVNIRFWGVTQRLAGTSDRVIELPADATVAQAIEALEVGDALAQELKRCAFSVGTQIVTRSQTLSDGDELAVLPPVNGG